MFFHFKEVDFLKAGLLRLGRSAFDTYSASLRGKAGLCRRSTARMSAWVSGLASFADKACNSMARSIGSLALRRLRRSSSTIAVATRQKSSRHRAGAAIRPALLRVIRFVMFGSSQIDPRRGTARCRYRSDGGISSRLNGSVGGFSRQESYRQNKKGVSTYHPENCGFAESR